VLVADRTDHRAGDAVHDMRPVAEFFDFLDDGVFLLGGDVVFKYDYHFGFIFCAGGSGPGTKKAAGLAACGWVNSVSVHQQIPKTRRRRGLVNQYQPLKNPKNCIT
jgi:hypothetical protein